MKHFNLHAAQYCVAGLTGFSFNKAIRCWKTKFDTITRFTREVITHPGLEAFGELVKGAWDSAEPITVQEALQEENMEIRRVMFDCIGVSRLFGELQPLLLDKQVVHKTRMRWDHDNRPYEFQFDDTYELYQIDGEKLFVSDGSRGKPNPVYAVRCWCTSTNREFWIYVPAEAALGAPSWRTDVAAPDAVRAIAWTIRIDVSHPKRIYRQGDIIVVEESEQSTTVTPYHLSKEQYLSLMYAET